MLEPIRLNATPLRVVPNRLGKVVENLGFGLSHD